MKAQEALKPLSLLELEYEKAGRICDLEWKDERNRRLQLQILLLEHERELLYEQIDEGDARTEELRRDKDAVEDDRAALQDAFVQLQQNHRSRTREIQQLQTELQSLHGVSTNSTRLLSEKLALAHELSNLKPELDHLRSQAALHQVAISEKLSIQRQLSTLQVELDNEKRASHRAIARGEKGSAKEGRMEDQIEELQSLLAKEKKSREQLEKETKKSTKEWENKKSVFESKLEALKGKLRSTEQKLSESQFDLRKVETASQARDGSRISRKRTIGHMIDEEIGTPGPNHKARRSTKAVGNSSFMSTKLDGKSVFSLTPMINRTKAFGDTTVLDVRESIEEESQAVSVVPVKTFTTTPMAPFPLSPSKEQNVLRKASISPSKSKKAAARSLAKVMEENDENVPPEEESLEKPVPQASVAEPKKKRRRLLAGAGGKTLFDDDEPDVKRAGGMFGVERFGKEKQAPGISGFGQFSPLKKQKKAAIGQ